MTDAANPMRLRQSLMAYGADFSRWPAERAVGGREALLADPVFRRAWDDERALDGALARSRDDLDAIVVASGAIDRLASRTLDRLPGLTLAGLRWQRVAAAMLVAGMLGGATDAFLAEPVGVAAEMAGFDPLASLDEAVLP